MKKVIIMLPTLNEDKNIGEIIDELENKIFPQINDFEPHILVVDDSSTDGTIDIVNKKIDQYHNIALIIDVPRGLGVAYKRGVNFAISEMDADIIIKMDADFQHDPKYIIQMLEKYRQGFDYVIASRYCKGASVPAQWGFFRKVISKYGGLYTRIVLFFPHFRVVTDVSSGFALGSVKKVLSKIDYSVLTSGFYYSQQIIFQIVKMGIKIAEIPINFGIRINNDTKMPMNNIIGTFLSMPLLRIKNWKNKKI